MWVISCEMKIVTLSWEVIGDRLNSNDALNVHRTLPRGFSYDAWNLYKVPLTY